MDNSSYTDYLPPVLWVPENDPTRFLARSLRVFERILTGIPVRSEVLRAEGAMVSAAGNQIVMAGGPDAQRFRVSDRIQIVGTPHIRTVVTVDTAALILDAAVPVLGPGAVRIADLEPGQNRFRVDTVSGLGPAMTLQVRQGPSTEDVVVATTDHEFVTIVGGLANVYAMTPAAMPVVLTDGTVLSASGRSYDDFETTIDHLADLFSPWRTRPEFLPWLASWVALRLRPDWDDYQTRWLIAEITRIYRQRGLKRGLLTYLGIYAPSAARPRIAIDDGDAVLRLDRQDDSTFRYREVVHANTVTHPGGTVTVALHPTGIATDGANETFVCDEGDVGLGVPRPPALWRFSPVGEVPYQPGPPAPLPQPIASGPPLALPTAVVVDAQDRVSVLDIGNAAFVFANDQDSLIVRYAPPAYAPVTVISQATVPPLPAIHPVDMVLDAAGNFVVLDRGLHAFGDPPVGPTAPQLIVVSEGPLSATQHALAAVTEPTAITIDSVGRFIVADARDQQTATPAELFRVDPGAGFAQTPLLNAVPAGENPLVYPTGLAFEDPDTLLVLDLGLRMGFVGDTKNRRMAEDAAVYRVDLSQNPPTITRVTAERALVHPSKLTLDRNGDPLVVDRGESMTGPPTRSWRATAHEFGVVLLFSNQRPTSFAERNSVRQGVADVISEHKPGQTVWWMDF